MNRGCLPPPAPAEGPKDRLRPTLPSSCDGDQMGLAWASRVRDGSELDSLGWDRDRGDDSQTLSSLL